MKRKNLLVQLVLVIIILLLLMPVIYMILVSLTPHEELFKQIIPTRLTFENFIRVLTDINQMRHYLNTWIIALSTATLTLILASFAGYGLSRFNFKSKNTFIIFMLVTQMLPLELLIISYFLIIKRLGLYNTHLALILVDTTLTLPFVTLMLKTVFDNVPKEIEDSAMVDGCSPVSSFIRIVIPISRSGLFAAFVFSFLVAYGEFLFGLTLTKDVSAMPMTVQMMRLLGRYFVRWEIMIPLALVFSLPIFIIFAIVQESFIRGLTSGSLKDV